MTVFIRNGANLAQLLPKASRKMSDGKEILNKFLLVLLRAPQNIHFIGTF
jgi:hypothetical protein